MRYVRVPMERVGVLVGPAGRTRRQIERRTDVRLQIDSESGEVTIDDHKTKDPLAPLVAQDVVRALGRGFSPEHAFALFAEDVSLAILDIHDYVGKRANHVHRMVGRVVGTRGKTRRVLEELTGAYVAVYGHTVGIIGDDEAMGAAKQAVDMILSGSEHANVYRFLESRRRSLRIREREF